MTFAPFFTRQASLNGGFRKSLDEWKRADAIWHQATDALLDRDYERFDELMRQFRSTTRTWTPRERGAGNSSPSDT